VKLNHDGYLVEYVSIKFKFGKEQGLHQILEFLAIFKKQKLILLHK
jgi:hypothetical protein